MPSTQYNLTQIQRYAPNYASSEILGIMDEVQKIVYSQDSEQTIKIDSSTGMPPILETTDGVFQYECPADCRRTAKIFTESWPYPYARTRPALPDKEYYFRHRLYYDVSVHSRDAIVENSQKATVTFYINPGDTTDKYYHMYYILPTELTDVNIQLTLPDQVHWRFRKACIAMLATEEFGQTGLNEQIIEKQIKKIRQELNKGASTIMGKTPLQVEYTEFPETYYGYRA